MKAQGAIERLPRRSSGPNRKYGDYGDHTRYRIGKADPGSDPTKYAEYTEYGVFSPIFCGLLFGEPVIVQGFAVWTVWTFEPTAPVSPREERGERAPPLHTYMHDLVQP